MDLYGREDEERRKDEDQKFKQKLDEEDKKFLALFGNKDRRTNRNNKRYFDHKGLRDSKRPRGKDLKAEIDKMEEELDLRQNVKRVKQDPYAKLNIIDMTGQEEQQIFVSRRQT